MAHRNWAAPNNTVMLVGTTEVLKAQFEADGHYFEYWYTVEHIDGTPRMAECWYIGSLMFSALEEIWSERGRRRREREEALDIS